MRSLPVSFRFLGCVVRLRKKPPQSLCYDHGGLFEHEHRMILASARAAGAAWCTLWLSSPLLNEEDVVWELVADLGIPADDGGEGLFFDEFDQLFWQGGLVVEAVTIAKAAELIH